MNRAELLEVMLNGENSVTEFARDDLRPERLAKIGVAFANHQGGQILLGVENDGAIKRMGSISSRATWSQGNSRVARRASGPKAAS